jgi:hypothetical protein
MRPMSLSRAIAVAAPLAALASSGPAPAQEVQTPACQRDLAASVQLIAAIQAREKNFVRGDMARNCELLRQNLDDMVKAREPLDRCLTGTQKSQTTQQLDASIGDMRGALAGSCR